MNDGVIKNNVAYSTGNALYPAIGGGIGGGSNFGTGLESTFIMDGGIISGNVARNGGGVRLFNANVTINDGSISGNEVIRIGASGNGGGLDLLFTDLTMNGGTINGNNAAESGGGMRLSESIIIMNDGIISENNAAGNNGGGVSLSSGTIFTMNNGTISENEVRVRGGGVSVNGSSEFIMNGGIINKNTANADSGGIHINFDSTFTMHDGAIIDNAAGAHGGGVRLSIRSTFTMNAGIIDSNAATTNGGGVFVDGTNNMFTMNGGTINGNTAITGNGGGVFLVDRPDSPRTFTMTGGAITNNVAEAGDGGGVFSMLHEDYPNPLTPMAYNNITFENGTISENTAGNGRYALPINYYTRTFGHLLNNHEINFRGSHRVEVITFDLNGGNVNGDTDDVESLLPYGVQAGMANVPTVERLGYNFLGWLLGAESIIQNADVASMYVYESKTFTAQWERILFTPCCVDCCLGEYECHEPCSCNCCEACGSAGCPKCIVAQYRNIRIYYYLQDSNTLECDTDNNAIGRNYTVRVGETFNLSGVLDRNTLDSENDYVFEGWRVYVDGMPHLYYLYEYGKDVLELHGSFEVPAPTSVFELSMEQPLAPMNLNVVGDDISLIAVWMIYEVHECGNGESTTTPTAGNNNQKRLPQTGIESNMLLWSALLVLVVVTGLDTIAKIKRNKDS